MRHRGGSESWLLYGPAGGPARTRLGGASVDGAPAAQYYCAPSLNNTTVTVSTRICRSSSKELFFR